MLSEGSSVKGSPENKQASAPYIRGSAKISRRVTLARFTGKRPVNEVSESRLQRKEKTQKVGEVQCSVDAVTVMTVAEVHREFSSCPTNRVPDDKRRSVEADSTTGTDPEDGLDGRRSVEEDRVKVTRSDAEEDPDGLGRLVLESSIDKQSSSDEYVTANSWFSQPVASEKWETKQNSNTKKTVAWYQASCLISICYHYSNLT